MNIVKVSWLVLVDHECMFSSSSTKLSTGIIISGKKHLYHWPQLLFAKLSHVSHEVVKLIMATGVLLLNLGKACLLASLSNMWTKGVEHGP